MSSTRKHGNNIYHLGLGDGFSDMIDKVDFIKFKNLHASEDTIKKRQSTKWEKIFAKRLLIKIYEELFL